MHNNTMNKKCRWLSRMCSYQVWSTRRKASGLVPSFMQAMDGCEVEGMDRVKERKWVCDDFFSGESSLCLRCR